MDKNNMLPKGKYYVGDPCYVLKEHNGFDWGNVLDEHDYFSDRGYYKLKDKLIFAGGTAYGDGDYKDLISNREFGVDAGLLSFIPVEILDNLESDPNLMNYAAVIDFPEDFVVSYEAGFFTADNGRGEVFVRIDTEQAYLDEEEDDC